MVQEVSLEGEHHGEYYFLSTPVIGFRAERKKVLGENTYLKTTNRTLEDPKDPNYTIRGLFSTKVKVPNVSIYLVNRMDVLSRVKVRVENIVASIDLHGEIDLEKVVSNLKNVEYDPSIFPGAIYKLEKPKTTFLIFDTGKLVCTGAKNTEEIKEAVKTLVRQLEKLGMKFSDDPTIEIQNLVASGDLNMGNLDLDIIALTLPNCEYEPEIFPGIIYRVRGSRLTVLLFTTGKIVVAGARNEDDVWFAVKNLLEELEKYELVNMGG